MNICTYIVMMKKSFNFAASNDKTSNTLKISTDERD